MPTLHLRRGLYVSLVNQNTQRIVFSAATDAMTEAQFSLLWGHIGELIYKGLARPESLSSRYELRVEPTDGHLEEDS